MTLCINIFLFPFMKTSFQILPINKKKYVTSSNCVKLCTLINILWFLFDLKKSPSRKIRNNSIKNKTKPEWGTGCFA